MEREERKNDKGPLVDWYKSVPTIDEGVAPPFLGKVNGPNKFRTVERPLDGGLNVMGGLLEHVLYDFFRRHEVGINFRGDDLVQHLVK